MSAPRSIGGLLLEGGPELRAAFGIDEVVPALFFRAEEVRGVRFATSLRWVGHVAGYAVGAALVDGRIVAAVRAGAAASLSGALLHAADRNESLLVLGPRILATGAFEIARREGFILHEGAEVPISSPGRLFDELERASWESRRSAPASSDERRSPLS